MIIDAGYSIPTEHWFSEQGVSGSIKATERPEFAKMMQQAKEGDRIIVTMIDRLGRDAEDVLHTINKFKALGIKLIVMQFDGMDVTSIMGKVMVTMAAAIAEMERNTIRERTKAGIARTRAQGTRLGKPLAIAPEKLEAALEDFEAGDNISYVSKKYGIPRNTLSANISRWKGKMEDYRKEWNLRQEQYKIAA
jgi:DNA invertase Pin-like site-specific DNA recombinase